MTYTYTVNAFNENYQPLQGIAIEVFNMGTPVEVVGIITTDIYGQASVTDGSASSTRLGFRPRITRGNVAGSDSGSNAGGGRINIQVYRDNNDLVGSAALAASGSTIGDIKIWSGSIATIPSGWHLCDGTNGTPDLRDQFVLGAGNSFAVGATGGTTTLNHSGDHTHNISATGGNDNVVGGAGAYIQNITIATSTQSAQPAQHGPFRPPYYSLAFIQRIT